MYRPPNWAKIKRALCHERLKDVGGAHCETCPADPQTCGIPQEETVDAFLEAICAAIKEEREKEALGSLFRLGYGSVLTFLDGEGFE